MKLFSTRLVPAALALAVSLSACSGNAGIVVKADRTISVSVALSLPQPVEAWARSQLGAGAGAPLFDAAGIASGAKARGLIVTESLSGPPGSWRGSFAVADADSFLLSPRPALPADEAGRRPVPAGSLSSLGVMKLERGPGWASLRVRLGRDNAAAVLDLFPGLDRDLLDALMPPAAYDNPATKAQYRSMLAALMGKTAAAAIDTAAFTLSITLPGPIIDSGGASAPAAASGRTVSFTLAALDAMTLESPAEFFVKWRE